MPLFHGMPNPIPYARFRHRAPETGEILVVYEEPRVRQLIIGILQRLRILTFKAVNGWEVDETLRRSRRIQTRVN